MSKHFNETIGCYLMFLTSLLFKFLILTLFFCFLMWFQSDESVYERECGNMPGFAVYYRYPNSQRVTYGQFIRVSYLSWTVQLLNLSLLISTEEVKSLNGHFRSSVLVWISFSPLKDMALSPLNPLFPLGTDLPF